MVLAASSTIGHVRSSVRFAGVSALALSPEGGTSGDAKREQA